MKLPHILSAFALFISTASVSAERFPPVGELSIDNALVRAGIKPTLTWNISYPTVDADKTVRYTSSKETKKTKTEVSSKKSSKPQIKGLVITKQK